MTENQNLTTSFGIPVGDSQNSLTAGSNGPILFQDFYLIKKLAHFNLISLEQLEKIFDWLEC